LFNNERAGALAASGLRLLRHCEERINAAIQFIPSGAQRRYFDVC
jgi:hypothetical protein